MISVVIPCYEQNGSGVRYMTELLNSLHAQTDIDFEVIVSDNSRDDGIKKLCAHYTDLDLHYYRNNKTFGVSNNTNNALENVSSDFIKVMYQDDFFLKPTALKQFYEALQDHSWAVSFSKIANGNSNIGRTHGAQWNDRILEGINTLGMPSCHTWRRNEIRFDNKLTTCLDCEFYWLLHRKYGEPFYIRKPLVAQRYWNGSVTNTEPNTKDKDYLYLKQKYSL